MNQIPVSCADISHRIAFIPRAERYSFKTSASASGEIACAGIRIKESFRSLISTPVSPSAVTVCLCVHVLCIAEHCLVAEFIYLNRIMQLIAHRAVYVCPFVVVDVLVFYEQAGIRSTEYSSAAVRDNTMIVCIVSCTGCCIIQSVICFSLQTVSPGKLLECMSSVTAYCRTHGASVQPLWILEIYSKTSEPSPW